MSIIDKELEANFHLVGVADYFGHQIEHRKNGGGTTFTTVLLRECQDLILTRPLKVEFEIPHGYPSSDAGPIHCFPDDIEPFRASEVVRRCPEIIVSRGGKVELVLPWMADSNYPISVWFFSVRILLKKKSLSSSTSQWATPLLQRNVFPHKRRFHRSKESSSNSVVRIMTGTGRNRGKRPYMEDFDFSFGTTRMSDVYTDVQALGVLDGHGGQECASFVAEELPGVISSIARREGGTRSMSRGTNKLHKAAITNGAALPEILFKSFLQVDADFLRTTSHTSGSTACIMLFDRKSGRAFVGNTGDTRAVVCRGGKALNVTLDMKATDPEQIARVAMAGGHVTKGRVMGALAVARAFGDAQLKKGKNLKHGLWESGQEALICDPEITSFRPRRIGDARHDDEFMIIATDGLWDVMDSQQAVDAVKKGLKELPSGGGDGGDVLQVCEADLARIADSIASQAVSLGSMDNITIMIVYFTGYDMDNNSDDEDDGEQSDDEAVTDTSPGQVPDPYTGARFSAKHAFEDDLRSLLENVPNKFAPRSSNSNIIPDAANVSYIDKTLVKTSCSLNAGTLLEAPSASARYDDDLDMDFLLDDSNF